MSKKRTGLLLCISLTLILGLLTACSDGASPSNQSSTVGATKAATSEPASGDVINKCNVTGLPIAAEPVTLKIAVPKPSSSYRGDWEILDWIKQIQEASGVTIEFYVWQSSEELNLIFTSRDYPDMMWGGASDTQILQAAQGGDIYQLDELIDTYSPNWKKFLSENEYARKVVTLSDGHIWSLPIVRDEPSNGGLRDQWLINKAWLDELDLEVPTTTEEFYNVLKAFKENAGVGSIPDNVIPYYIYGIINNVGGALDDINSFGVRVANERGLITVDDNGKVEFNFADEAIKEPLHYLRSLYAEGLIPSECLTDDWDTYLSKTRSDPPIVGSYHSYQNPDASNTKIMAFGPLDSGNGNESRIRRQTNHVLRNMCTIFTNNQYPEISMRLADLIADEDWSIQAMYGMYGDEYLQKNDDGTITMHPYAADAQGATSAPMNSVPFLLTEELFGRFTYAPGSAQGQRADAIANVYSPYTLDVKNLYPNVSFTEDQTSHRAELATDITDYIRSTVANWMLNGGIDEEWDDYIAQLNKLGLEEYIQISQDALDTFNAN